MGTEEQLGELKAYQSGVCLSLHFCRLAINDIKEIFLFVTLNNMRKNISCANNTRYQSAHVKLRLTGGEGINQR